MRAFAVESFGESPKTRDIPIPTDVGRFLIRVSYAGVNPLDYKLLDQLTIISHYPFVLGIDYAGVIEHVPSQEKDLQVGDRVFGMARTHGAYADYTSVAPDVKTEPLARIPDGVTDEQAAALPIPAITSLRSLQLLNVSADQYLVVMGAAGVVGGYTVQMAQVRGAHVIATVRGNSDEARRLGAEEVYDTATVDVLDAIHDSHPDGVDAVLDLVNGQDTIHGVTQILKPQGTLVSTLYSVDEQWFAQRHITAYNISSLTNPLSSPQGLTEVSRLLANGTITARIHSRFVLDDAGQMFEKLRSGRLSGKTVIHI